MVKCNNCGYEDEEDTEFCFNCSIKRYGSSRDFAYNQLFELMRLEIARSARLDSKAHAYIGFLSIAVTILGTLGAIIIENIKTQGIMTTNIIFTLSIFYVFVVMFFIFGVLSAFWAYHKGSIFMENKLREEAKQGKRPKRKRPKSKEVFFGFDVNWLSEYSEIGTSKLQKSLIPHLREIHERRYLLNNDKSDCILYAFMFTMVAISLLLCIVITIGIYGMGLV